MEIQLLKLGIICVEVEKFGCNGEAHRFTLAPGDNVTAAFLQLNGSLCALGFDELTLAEWAKVEAVCAAEWTTEVVADYVSRTAPKQIVYTQQDYANAVESRLDKEAQALGYDSVARAATYVSSLNSKFATEAAYFITLRDACWLLCFAALGDPPAVKPTPAEFAEAIVAQALATVGQPIYS